mmetsp:Transcript_50326/g.133078  ORF Transcript_50326/g.133078 Transcript_50326/m.133078 type:complete len:286 (-) Transcript_50326:59-916(-)
MNAAMQAAIAAHQEETKKKTEEAAPGKVERERKRKEKKETKKGAGGFMTFDSFDARASQAIAHGKRAREEKDSDTDSEEEDDREDPDVDRLAVVRVDWSDPPAELKPRGEAEFAEKAGGKKFVAHFIRYCVGKWRMDFESGAMEGVCDKMKSHLGDVQRAMYLNVATIKGTEEMLAPLVKLLEKGEVAETIMPSLEKMATFAADRDYKAALGPYMELTVGKKKWNNAVFFGEAKHNKGFNARRVKRDEANAFDESEVVQKYVQGLRRIMNYAQLIRPNDDVSKHM